jgi:deoxycytidylate deaminase
MRNDPLVLDELSISDGASYHAEYDAMRKLGFEVPSRATIYVARVNKQGVTRLSRPCDKCWKLLLKYEIKEVVYTV